MSDAPVYSEWIREFETFDPRELESAGRFGRSLRNAPTIDVVMPVYNPPEPFLRAAIAAVCSQIYQDWTLCIVDDCSSEPHVRPILESAARADRRVRVVFAPENSGVAGATNAAIALGKSDYVAFFDHDDVIAPHAFLLVAHRLSQVPRASIVYTDSDFIDTSGERTLPFFKPDYDHDLLLGVNFPFPLFVCERSLLERVGGMRHGFDGSEDPDLVFRLVEQIDEDAILHVPHVLYHWRIVPSSSTQTRTSAALAGARRAIREHCERIGRPVVEAVPRSLFWDRVRYVAPPAPIVVALSNVRPDRVQATLDAWKSATDYAAVRWLVADGAELERTPASLRNQAWTRAETELVAFADARFAPVNRDWLLEMTSHFADPRCAVVGGRSIDREQRVEEAGIVLGVRDAGSDLPVARALRGFPQAVAGYFGWADLAHRVSAVSEGVTVYRKALLQRASLFDRRLASPLMLDVDACLAARRDGSSVVFTPYAEFRRIEAAPDIDARGSFDILSSKWGQQLERDPYYSLNFTSSRADFTFASPPRVRLPWR